MGNKIMKAIFTVIMFMSSGLLCFGQADTLNYGDTTTVQGKVAHVTYKIHTGNWHDTYILQLDKNINVNPNDEWEGLSEVMEVHLNIVNNEIEQYKDQKIEVTGLLFHALTFHHIRDICIKVETINISP